MSDGDSNDKENSATMSSSSSASSPSHPVPDNEKLAPESLVKEVDPTAAPAANGDSCEPTKTDAPSSNNGADPPALGVDGAAGDPPAVAAAPLGDPIDIKVVWNKNKYDVVVRPEETVLDLKNKMQELTQLPPAMQKIMFKGLCKDDRTMKVRGNGRRSHE